MKRIVLATTLITALIIVGALFFSHQKPKTISPQSPKPIPNTDLLITHATIITVNPSAEIIKNGWITATGGKITGIGPGNPNPEIFPKKTIDAKGNILIPGLINMHTHMGMTGLQNKVKANQLPAWLATLGPLEARLTTDDVYTASKQGIEESIKNGVTTINDMYFFPESSLQAARELGIRAFIRLPLETKNDEIIFDQSLLDKRTDLINFTLAPNPIVSYNLTQLLNIARIAQAYNLPVHIHFASDTTEEKEYKSHFNLSLTDTLKQSTLLNTRLILAHSIFLNDKDIATLAQFPTIAVVSTPRSELRLGTKPTPLTTFLNKKITTSLGTDGSPSSGNLDLFEDMRAAALNNTACSGSLCENGLGIKPEEIFRMATTHAAESLGMANLLGSIEKNKAADLVILNTSDQRFSDDSEIYNWLVYSASGKNVLYTIINGSIVFDNKNP